MTSAGDGDKLWQISRSPISSGLWHSAGSTAVGAGLGFMLAGVISESWLVFAEGVAAGAMLTMIAAAMIPEAAEHGRPNEVGLSTLAGFLGAVMFKLLE